MSDEVLSGELVAPALTPREQKELTRQELRIEKALPSFLELADALSVIRDGRLYRAEFGTFDDYVSARWDMTRQRVSQLTSAADTVRGLPEDLVTRVTTERAARAIAASGAKPAKVRKALDRVANADGSEGSAAALERALTVSRAAADAVTAVTSADTGDVFGVFIAIAPAVAEGLASRPRGEVDAVAGAVKQIAAAFNERRAADAKDAPPKTVPKPAAKATAKKPAEREVVTRFKAPKK